MALVPNKKTSRQEKNVFVKSKLNKALFSNIIESFLNKNLTRIINNILFYLILFLLLKKAYTKTITIKVNRIGLQKILSDEYKGNCFPKPNNRLVNNSYNFPTSLQVTLNFDCKIDNFSYMFNNLENIIEIKIDNMFNSYVNLSYMFRNCLKLQKVEFIYPSKHKNAVNDTRGMFYNCQSLKSFSFEQLNLSFYNSYKEQIEPGSTELPKTIYEYFDKNMSYMFYNCINLESIEVNKGIIQYVSDMSYMFYNCFSLKSINLENFITGDILYINISYLFYNCTRINSITFNSTYKSFGIEKIDYMFYNCSNLTQIKLNHLKTDNDLNMSYLFYNCKNLTSVKLLNDYIKILDTREMFYNCIELTSLNFFPHQTSEEINMTKMFYNCNKLQNLNLKNGNSYFIPNDMSSMFYNCSSLLSLNLNQFQTDKVQYMSYLLYNCTNLIDFTISDYFNNSLITDMKGLFQNCESIEILDLTTFYTPNVEIMWDMFNGCFGLKNLSIPNFDTSKVTDMQSMFRGCRNLTSLNLNHFNTTNVQYMNEMFQNCENLQYLSISQISSDSLSTMYRMFYNCTSLEYLNIFNLIEDVQSITEMFEGTSDNFTFCIKEKENIPNIFNLLYKKIKTERDCSENCYGEGKGREGIKSQKRCCPYFFENKCYYKCPGKTKVNENTKICEKLSCDYPKYYNFSQNECIDNIPDGYYLNDTNSRTIDKCHEDCATCYAGANDTSKNCIKCKDDKPYAYFGNCYKSCRYGYFYDSYGIKKCKCHREKCQECTKESLKYDLCVSCNEDEKYYEIFNHNNENGFIDCYKEKEGYYFDYDEYKYKPCYPSCKYCYKNSEDKSHHYCKNCSEENSYSILDKNNTTYMNCFPECKYNYYFNETGDYICTKNLSCPSAYPFLLENTTECIESCTDTYKYQFRHTCFEQCPYDSYNYTIEDNFYCNASCPFERPFEMTETQYCVSSCTIMDRYYKLCFTNYDGDRYSEVQDKVLEDFQNDIIDTFDYKFITTNQNIIHEEKNAIYEITSTKCTYQDPRTTTIYLDECESKLKEYYSIDKNEALYIFKVDAYIEGKTGPKVEYEIYYPLDGKNLRLLDISLCEGKEIFIGYPLNISIEELDLYNSNSGYYNDICYTYTNSKGTDVTLYDRKNEFMNNNKNLCEENCQFSGYNEIKGRLNCSCEVKYSLSLISEIKIDKNKLNKFINIKQFANFSVMKCLKLLFSIKGIQTNIGFYSFLPLIITYIITLFIFYLKELKRIMNQINEIIAVKKLIFYSSNKKQEKNKKLTFFHNFIYTKRLNLGTIKEEILRHKQDNKNNNDIKIASKKDKIENIKNNDESEDNYESIINSIKLKKNDIINLKKIGNDKIQFKKTKSKQNNDSSKQDLIEGLKVLEINKVKKVRLTLEEKLKIIKVLKFNDNELNEFGYKNSIKYDKRNFCKYYVSLLLTKHNLFQIFNNRDYNAYSIKVLLFFFNFSSCFAVNALFFNDNTMHQIYEDEGNFNFIYQLPQIVFSTLISYFIDNITTFLALSEDKVLELKRYKNLENLSEKGRKAKVTLKIKFIFFFFINLVLILLFWYYLSCFCAVYRNTQYHLIKDTLISFGIGSITPFGTNILTALLRIYSLKIYTNRNQMLFNLSKLFQQYL